MVDLSDSAFDFDPQVVNDSVVFRCPEVEIDFIGCFLFALDS